MRRVRKTLMRAFIGLAALASILAAWVFWPRPIEGFWQDPGIVCCDGCRFLYFKDGRAYQFHEDHGAVYLGTYTRVSPGVYRFAWDHKDWGPPHTIYLHGLFLRWSDPTTGPIPFVWRLFSTTKPRQLLDTVPIRTLDGKASSLDAAGSEQPQDPAEPDHIR
jgi:hypothetical protein